MINKEFKEDILVRYGYILSKRFTQKQKDKAVFALEKDLKYLGSDVKIDNFNNHGKKNKNIYFGSIKTAKTIVATYYDTPGTFLGDYYPMDKDKQKKTTMASLLLSSILVIILGLLYTILFARKILDSNDLISLPSILIIVSYFLFFILLGKTARGLAYRKTMVRNTSSIIFMINMILENVYEKNTAFAFLDSGCSNNAGLERLSELNPRAEIIYLDSIGSDQDIKSLDYQGNEELFSKAYLTKNTSLRIGAEKIGHTYKISKESLNSRNINAENLENLYKELTKGDKNV